MAALKFRVWLRDLKSEDSPLSKSLRMKRTLHREIVGKTDLLGSMAYGHRVQTRVEAPMPDEYIPPYGLSQKNLTHDRRPILSNLAERTNRVNVRCVSLLRFDGSQLLRAPASLSL